MTEPLPPNLIEYEHQLTEAIRRRIDARRERRRRAVVPVAVCTTAAAVAGGVGLVGLTSSSGQPPVAQAAVLRGAVRAVQPPAGTILHVVSTDTDTDTEQTVSGPQHTDTRELWLLPVPAGTPCNVRQDCPALYLRAVYESSSGEVDSSTGPNDRTNLYDATTNTIDEPPSLVASWQVPEPFDGQNLSSLDPFSTQFSSQLQQAIDAGSAHVVGDSTVDGQSVVEIAGESDICRPAGDPLPPALASRPSQGGQTCEEFASWTYDVTPASYTPVRLQSTTGRATNTIAFQTWETLPAAQNMSVFDLATQHPGARVDTSAADYSAEAQNANAIEGAPALATETVLPGTTPSSARVVRAPKSPAARRAHRR